MGKYSVFLTVGTQLPFDRLVRACETALQQSDLDISIVYQVGQGGYEPADGATFETLTREQFACHLSSCDVLVTHAGIGSIVSGLSLGKPVIVMPRTRALGEHRNDHQLATADRVKAEVQVVHDGGELRTALERLLGARASESPTDGLNREFGRALRQHIERLM